MFRPRIIPVLLLKGQGLVKSIKFKDHRYIGDPINAVKIFNDLRADELVFLDILATKEHRTISEGFVRDVGDEANMPFAVGGGITSLREIESLIKSGAEKIVINSEAVHNHHFILEASEYFGSSTVVVSIDVKRRKFSKQQVYSCNGSKASGFDPVDFAKLMEEKGAGELIINSIDHDGVMGGYDLDLIRRISDSVRIPVVALGGCGKVEDLKDAVLKGNASAAAAGSLFVYHGPRKAILINYPAQMELSELFSP